jgi:hypothetical protein
MIIQRTDFAPYIDISSNLKDAKLEPQVNEAMQFDVCGLMGNDFFYDFMQYVNPDGGVKTDSPQQYQDLFNGSLYNENYVNPGLKPVIVYFSSARLLRSLDLHVTPNAIMTKRNDFSDHAEYRAIGQKATEYENRALAYWNKLTDFINDSGKVKFPLWNGFKSCGSGSNLQPRQRIFTVKGAGTNGY